MTIDLNDDRISSDLLAEQWFTLFHGLMGDLRAMFRDLAKQGLTQKIIAKRLGKKNSEVISRAMSGQKNLTIRYLHDLARAMGCRLDIKIVPINELPKANRPRYAVTTTTPMPTTSNSSLTPARAIYVSEPRAKELA